MRFSPHHGMVDEGRGQLSLTNTIRANTLMLPKQRAGLALLQQARGGTSSPQFWDINTDPDCDRTVDPDIAPGGSLCPDVIMTSGGSKGHSDQLGLWCQ